MKYRVREIRKERGMTQEELASRSGVSRATIWALEKGEDIVTTTKTLYNIAEALNVEMDDLFLTKGA